MAKINLGKVVPEKGVDYFTDAEIAQFKQDIEEDIDARLDTDEANIATNANNIASNTSAISALDTRMTSAESDISGNTSDINTLSGKVTTLENDMTTAKSDIQENAGDIDTLNQQQTVQDAAIEANAQALVPLADVPERMTAIEESDTEQNERLTELEEENESLRHDLNTSTLDSTDEISDNVTLENTVDARFKKLVPLGRTEQHTTSGKNFYNKYGDFNYPTTEYQDKTVLLSNGTIQSTANIAENASRGIRLQNLKSNTDYVVSGTLISSTSDTSTKGAVRAMGYTTGWSSIITQLLSDTGSFTFIFNTGDYTDFYISLNASGTPGGSYEAIYDEIMVSEQGGDFEEYTGGIASPNSNYPQEIKNVEGKNIFDKNSVTYKDGYYLNDNGEEVSNSATGYTTSFYNVRPKTVYTISGTFSNTTGYLRIYYYDINKNFISRTTSSSITTGSYTFTTPNDCYYIQFQYKVGYVDFDTIQIEEGSAATLYVPYNSIGFKVENKNLFTEVVKIAIGTRAASPSGYAVMTDSPNYRGFFLKVKENNVLSMSRNSLSSSRFRIGFTKDFPIHNTPLYNFANHDNDLQIENIVVPSEMNYLVIYLSNTNEEPTNIQIEKNSTSTEYITHQEQTSYFTFEEGQYLAEDGCLEDRGIFNKRNHVILDGVSNGKKVNIVSLYSSNGLYYCVCNNVFTDGKTFTSGASVENLLCSHFKPITDVALNHCYRTGNGFTFVFVLIDQTITTVEQANAWLAEQYANGTPVKVEYPLGNPQPTPYTPTQQAQWKEIKKMMTYKEQTNITGIGNLNPDIEAVGIKDIASVINNLDARLSLLE